MKIFGNKHRSKNRQNTKTESEETYKNRRYTKHDCKRSTNAGTRRYTKQIGRNQLVLKKRELEARESEKKRKEEARLERARRLEEEKNNKGKKKSGQKKDNEPAQEGVDPNDSREGIRAHARGRAYIPGRFDGVTAYVDPNELIKAQQAEAEANGGTKGKKNKKKKAESAPVENKPAEQTDAVKEAPAAEETPVEEAPAVAAPAVEVPAVEETVTDQAVPVDEPAEESAPAVEEPSEDGENKEGV